MASTMELPDRIEKTVVLRHPRSRAWRALSTADEFGKWFGVRLMGELIAGATARGAIETPGYEHLTLELRVESVEPERLFSFRWHPAALDPAVDYSSEPRTLVTFLLEAVPEGTRLTISEAGFHDIPEHRRAEAYRLNEQGWSEQVRRIGAYLDGALGGKVADR